MSDVPATQRGLVIVTADERPDLWARAEDEFRDVWPEYNQHGDVSGEYFGALVPRYAHLQFVVWDTEGEELVARGRSIPFRWDGTLADLPAGIDAMGLRAVRDPAPPTVLSALAAEVLPDKQGSGVSRIVVGEMAERAAAAGFEALVAPVRPSWKERYPLIPIEEYAAWTRDDGLPWDPWLRVHARLAATTLRLEPHSMQITGSVDEWTEWTGMEFRADGHYVFPHGLAPLEVRDGIGRYWEPNIWMLHRVTGR
jgi:GNAT superfamily N-acetyltransferase